MRSPAVGREQHQSYATVGKVDIGQTYNVRHFRSGDRASNAPEPLIIRHILTRNSIGSTG
jgi:hypothetical protein